MNIQAVFRTSMSSSVFGISPKGRKHPSLKGGVGGGLVFLFLFTLVYPIHAQRVSVDNDTRRDYTIGLEHFQKKKYAAAQQRFAKALEAPETLSSMERENAEYYRALCGLELFNEDGDVLMERFVKEHPEHSKIAMAHYHLGRYAFGKKKYKKALAWFAGADEKELNAAEKEELHFKKGYAYFHTDDHDRALKEFALVGDDIEGAYYAPITYYTAYILFTRGEYDDAYEKFSLLEGDETFGKIVPLYVLQILQAQGKDQEVVEYGQRLMGKDFSDFSSGNLHRMIGEAYYQMGEFSMAVPYLEEAYAKLRYDRDATYRLAYACYQSGKFEKATTYFEQVCKEKDAMAQMACYQMADAYLKGGDKMAARNAFELAAEMDFDKELKETALFNYAKLSFELSYDPQNEAITAFEKYVDEQLGSERADEAQELIMNVYLSTNNYEGALASIDKISKKTAQHKMLYEQTALKHGMELFNQGNYERSIGFFEKAYRYDQDKETAAKAMFWQAEAHAALKQFPQAISLYERHISAIGADRTDVYKMAHYGLAYVYFTKDEPANAIDWFLKYLELERYDLQRVNDANLRIADCYYVQKNTGKAIAYYNKAIGMNGSEADYALFQVAMCYGLQGKSSSKISKLKSLLSTHPNSEFVVDAKYEIGETYFFSDKPQEAVEWFDRVIAENPRSQYVSRCLLNKALVFYNANDDERALPLFKQVASDFAGTSEASEAMLKIQKIYVEQGNVKLYENYLASHQLPDASKGSLDTSYFESAQLMMQRGEMANALKEFEKYLEKFPNGFFALDAHFYMGEISFNLKQYDDALAAYNHVLEFAKTGYTERALVAAAEIHIFKKQYDQAQMKYLMLEEVAERSENLLEARIGLMRSNFELQDFETADEYVQKVLRSDRVEQLLKDEARLISAKCALGLDNRKEALIRFQEVARTTKNVFGAEAMYNVANIQLLNEDVDQSQATIFDMVNRFSGYQFWLGKAFILLADTYMKQNDLFQARLTLQNVVENYDGVVKNEAEDKLRQLEKFEAFSNAE